MRATILLVLFQLLVIGKVQAQNIYEDISSAARIDFAGQHIGVACSDYDRDGDMDIYVSVRDGQNLLLQNQGGFRFQEVGFAAGVAQAGNSRTSIFGDFNNDGWPDLYVGNFAEADLLYLNNGDGTFQEITQQAGINNPDKTFSVNLADVDRDGYLDIYLANFQSQNKLYRNLGNGTFEDWTNFSRAYSVYNAMGAIFFDYDNDGDQDLYLTHDGQPNILYQNIGNGRFFDASRRAKVDYQGFGMGVDVADINRDGWLDIYITNLYENVLFLNQQDGTFRNISAQAATDDYGMAWGTNFLDYDNDGWTDIYVTNDSYFSPYPNVLYRNNGDSTFSVSAKNQPIASMQGGYGSATADFDQDGFLDIVIANAARNDNLQLFQNQIQTGNWIQFQLEGSNNNRDAIGARLELWDNQGNYHLDEINAGSGYASQNSPLLHFGLDSATEIDSMQVRWPDGFRQKLYNIQVNKIYHLQEGLEQVEPLSTITTTRAPIPLAKKWSIYPNPVREQLFVELSDNQEKYQLQLTDALGHIYWHTAINSKKQLDTSELPAGIYHLKLYNEHYANTRQIIVVK